MPIPPYFPEPLTVPGNVAEAKHRVRVGFVRRVVAGHFLTSLLVGVSAIAVPLVLPGNVAALAFLGGLIALTFQRRTLFGGMKDNLLSLAVLLPTLFALSQVLRWLSELGWPVAALAPTSIGLALYALLCGNDFSYMGQAVLCVALTFLCLLMARAVGILTNAQTASGALIAVVYVFYVVYDLSMLVKRRRLGEEVAAVADLYRDLLNFVTYSVRVYFHWRKFRFI